MIVASLSNYELRLNPSTGFQVAAGTPSLYLSPGGGEILGDFPAVTDADSTQAWGGVQTVMRQKYS